MYETQSHIENNYPIHLPAGSLCPVHPGMTLNACSSSLDTLLVQVSESKPSHILQHHGFHSICNGELSVLPSTPLTDVSERE